MDNLKLTIISEEEFDYIERLLVIENQHPTASVCLPLHQLISNPLQQYDNLVRANPWD